MVRGNRIRSPSHTDSINRVINTESLQISHFRLLHNSPPLNYQSLYRCVLPNSASRARAMSSASSSSSATEAETLRRSRILKSKLYFDVPLSKVNL